MLKECILLTIVGVAIGAPRAQQYQHEAQAEVPAHLLRQYIATQQLAPSAQATQVLPRPTHLQGQAPARLPYAVQSEQQYQPAPQYQPQYRPQYQAQPVQYQRPQQQETRDPQEDYDPNPQYQFGFDVNDDQYTNYQNRKEERNGDVIKGSYSVVDSDGFIRTVTYTADPKEGFKAEVSRQPTDIVVKIPTPKPQLQQHSQPQQQLHQQQQQLHQQQLHHQQQHQPQQQQAPQQYYRYQQQ